MKYRLVEKTVAETGTSFFVVERDHFGWERVGQMYLKQADAKRFYDRLPDKMRVLEEKNV